MEALFLKIHRLVMNGGSVPENNRLVMNGGSVPENAEAGDEWRLCS